MLKPMFIEFMADVISFCNTYKQNLSMVVPYHQGLSEKSQRNMQQIWGTGSL